MTTTAAAATLVPAGTWIADPAHSKAGFAVKHMGIATVRGEFADFEGRLSLSAGDISNAGVEGRVGVASVDTRDEKRDAHLRSPDFFASDEHPEMTFSSTRVEPAGGDGFRVTGDLTLRGVTKEIVLDAEVQGADLDPYGNERVGIEITGELSRADFGMTFNQALGSGNLLVGDKVKLAIDISAIRQA
jgi:polyisoprenoid-binding protein YceI